MDENKPMRIIVSVPEDTAVVLRTLLAAIATKRNELASLDSAIKTQVKDFVTSEGHSFDALIWAAEDERCLRLIGTSKTKEA